MQSLQGQLLAARPDLVDPDFAKAVILLIQHCDGQAVGVVLNCRTDTPIKALWKTVIKKRCDLDGYVNRGGPVPGPPMAIHAHEPLSEIEVLSGVHYCVKKKNLESLGRLPPPVVQLGPVKIFDSHAGWGPGQLDAQIEEAMWQVVPATAELVFGDEDSLWENVVGQT